VTGTHGTVTLRIEIDRQSVSPQTVRVAVTRACKMMERLLTADPREATRTISTEIVLAMYAAGDKP